MKFLTKLSSFLVRLSAVVGCVLLIINIADITIGVLARQSGTTSIVWTEEVARFAMVWFVMFGATAAFASGDNMSIDFVVKRFPRPLRVFTKFVTVCIEALVLCVLVWYGWHHAQGGWKMFTMALRIPRAIPLMAVPVGMGMLLITLIAKYISGGADSAGAEAQGEGERA